MEYALGCCNVLMKHGRDGMALRVALRNAGGFGQGWVSCLGRIVRCFGRILGAWVWPLVRSFQSCQFMLSVRPRHVGMVWPRHVVSMLCLGHHCCSYCIPELQESN